MQSLHRCANSGNASHSYPQPDSCLPLKRGITLRKGQSHDYAALLGMSEDADSKLSGALRILLAQLKPEPDQKALRIDEADGVLEYSTRLLVNMKPANGSWRYLASGRLPHPNSSKPSATERPSAMGEVRGLDGCGSARALNRRQNSYLRKLFIQGARAVLQQRTEQALRLSKWLAKLASRTHHDVVAVALTNKPARIAWTALANEERCLPLALPSQQAA